MLHITTVEAGRDEYENGLAELQTARDIEVTSVQASEASFARSDTMHICVNGETQYWPQRIASSYHEVSNKQEHYSLREDLIEN